MYNCINSDTNQFLSSKREIGIDCRYKKSIAIM